MPKFTVRRYVDASVVYEAEIEAEDAHAASQAAFVDEDEIAWEERHTITYDARSFVTLDPKTWDPIHDTTIET
jgi:hypothetical protein